MPDKPHSTGIYDTREELEAEIVRRSLLRINNTQAVMEDELGVSQSTISKIWGKHIKEALNG